MGKRKKQPPWLFVDLAVTHGLIDVHQAEEVVDGLKVESGSADPLPYAQAMIRKGMIHGPDLVPMCGEAGLTLLRCGACHARFDREGLGDGICPQCKTELEREVDVAARLSDIAVLSCEGIDDLPVTVLTRSEAGTFPDASPRLARFQIQGELGRGGSAVVLKAVDPDLDRTCAIKVVRPGPGQSLNAIGRFQREAKLSARLHHPGIVAVYEVGRCPDFLFLVQEFVEGHSLADELAKKRPLSIARAVEVIGPALQALGYAHQNGVIHRDIKPQNIMVTPKGEVKLIDFGLGLDAAEAGENPEDPTLTRQGQAIGTPHFMSPEQVKSSHDVDPRTDLYSMGAVLYLCLTGRTHVRGKSVLDIVSQIVRDNARPPSLRNKKVPAGLDAVVLKALARERDERYPSAEEFYRELASIAVPSSGDDTGGHGYLDGGLPGATPANATPGLLPVTMKTPTAHGQSLPPRAEPDFLDAVTMKVPSDHEGVPTAGIDADEPDEAADRDDEAAAEGGSEPGVDEASDEVEVCCESDADTEMDAEAGGEDEDEDEEGARAPSDPHIDPWPDPPKPQSTGVMQAILPGSITPRDLAASGGMPIATTPVHGTPSQPGSGRNRAGPGPASKRRTTRRRAAASGRRSTTRPFRRSGVAPAPTGSGSGRFEARNPASSGRSPAAPPPSGRHGALRPPSAQGSLKSPSGRHASVRSKTARHKRPSTRSTDAVRPASARRAPVSARHARPTTTDRRPIARVPGSQSGSGSGSGSDERVGPASRAAARARRKSWSTVVAVGLAAVAGIVLLVYLQSGQKPDGTGDPTSVAAGPEAGSPGPSGGGTPSGGDEPAPVGESDPPPDAAPAGGGGDDGPRVGSSTAPEQTEPAPGPDPIPEPPQASPGSAGARAQLEQARETCARAFAARVATEPAAAREAFTQALAAARAARAAGAGAPATLLEADVLEEGLGDFDAARALYRELDGASEGGWIASLARARLALARGDGRAALVAAQAAARNLPDEPLATVTLGEAMIARGRVDEAKTVLRRAVARRDARVMPRLAMARAVLAEGDARRAISFLAGHASGGPHEATALALRGLAELSLKQRSSAVRSIRAAKKIAPRLPDVLLAEAFVGIAQANPTKARAALDAVLKARPEDLVALRTRAWVSVREARLGDALADVDRALAAAPGDGLSLAVRAIVMARQGRAEEALELARRAAEAGVAPAAIHAIRARARLGQGDADEALIESKRLLKAQPDSAFGFLMKGIALTHKGQAIEAIEALDRVAAIDQRSGLPQVALGNLALRQGRVDDAREHYAEALEGAPGLAAAHFGLGIAWMRQGRTHEAAESFETFVAARPEGADASVARRAAASARAGSTRLPTLTAREGTVLDSVGTTARFSGASIETVSDRSHPGVILELDLVVESEAERPPMVAVVVAVEERVVRALYEAVPAGDRFEKHFRVTIDEHLLRPVGATRIAICATTGFGEEDLPRMRRSIEADLDLGKMPGVPVATVSPEGTELLPLDELPDPLATLDPLSIAVGS